MDKKRKDLFVIEGRNAVVTRICLAKKKEFEEICALYASVRGGQFCSWDESYPTNDLLLEDLRSARLHVIKNTVNEIVAAVSICRDADLDGLSVWKCDEKTAISFMRLVVSPHYQGHGVARLMLSLAMNLVKRNGITSVRFLVGKNNVPVLCSYRKLQFDEVGSAQLFGEEWICFEKQLLTPREQKKWQGKKMRIEKRQHEKRMLEKQRITQQLREDEKYMRQALTQAKKASAIGEVPIGCVIVHDGTVIGRGYNRRNTDKSTLSHAEITAIRKAGKAVQDWRLEKCTLYVTLEPCQMCAGAIVQARMGRVVIGTMNPKAGCAGSVLNILQMDEFNHQVEVTTGVLKEDCAKILTDFFDGLRKRLKTEREINE